MGLDADGNWIPDDPTPEELAAAGGSGSWQPDYIAQSGEGTSIDGAQHDDWYDQKTWDSVKDDFVSSIGKQVQDDFDKALAASTVGTLAASYAGKIDMPELNVDKTLMETLGGWWKDMAGSSKEDAMFRNVLALKFLSSAFDTKGKALTSAQTSNLDANAEYTRTQTDLAKRKMAIEEESRDSTAKALEMLRGQGNGLINVGYKPLKMTPVNQRFGG